MTDTKPMPDAGGSTNTVETKPMDAEKFFLQRRVASLTGKKEEASQTQPATSEQPAETAPEVPTVPEAENTPELEQASPEQPKDTRKDVLSKLDLGNLSEQELDELAKKLGSGAVARYGELTAKRKQAEEKAAALAAEVERMRAEKTQATPKVENNPYADVTTLEELSSKQREAAQAVEVLEEKLFEASDLSVNDIAANINGRDYTKVELRKALLEAKKARDSFIPAQMQELKERDGRKALKAQLDEQMRKELAWLEGTDNDTRKQFETLRSGPVVEKIRKLVPEAEAALDYLFAHAANSMYGVRKVIPQESPSMKITPPSPARTQAAPSARVDAKSEAFLKDLDSRFRKTGDPEVWVKLQAAKLASRK